MGFKRKGCQKRDEIKCVYEISWTEKKDTSVRKARIRKNEKVISEKYRGAYYSHDNHQSF